MITQTQPGGSAGRRRAVTIPTLIVLTVVLTLGAPLWFALAALADLLTGPRRRRHLRLLALVWFGALLETLSVFICAAVWVAAAFGTAIDRPMMQTVHHRLQWWWARSLLKITGATLNLELDVAGLERLRGQPTIVLSRHICIADALVPAALLGGRLHYRMRHVLKRDLLWGPSLDIVGRRTPNHFVTRNARTPDEAGAVGALANDLGPDEAVVIFPEGTFYRPSRQRRALERIAQRDPVRAERVAALEHVLPIAPGGSLAALRAAPDADICIIAHHGFEAFESLGDIYRSVPFTEPVVAELFVFDRSTVPETDAERLAWLDQQWLAMDTWITAQRRH